MPDDPAQEPMPKMVAFPDCPPDRKTDDHGTAEHAADAHGAHMGKYAPLVMGALGVVYGDIGTSPLYTLKTALDWGGGATPKVALGVLSLIFWTLVTTTSVKYVALVMRADNDGEGGILALMSLLGLKGRERAGIVAIGLLGAALLYGDGAITPAISVLSALEGLKSPFPFLAPYVLPTAVVVLLLLFILQRQGTARIGRLFGPVMCVWFLTIGLLGLGGVMTHPGVMRALNPAYGMHYLETHGLKGIQILGAVFLCATGAEALYADMGHFGRQPIQIGWYALVLPTLVLSYAGQTALVLGGHMGKDANPFFALAPGWMQLPLVILSTVATVIASQAIISGVFSMTRQAIQLGLCPRLNITQTSAEGYGQIYVGFVNWTLMLFTLALAIGFGSSDNLAAAYGIAVSVTMLLTTMLMFRMMRERWRWSLPASLAVAGPLLLVDTSFAAANMMKLFEGGWVPLFAASIIFMLMYTWRQGRAALLRQLARDTLPITDFIAHMRKTPRVPGTAVYVVRRLGVVPVAMLHSLKHYKVLHQRNVILHVDTAKVPRVAEDKRRELTSVDEDFYSIVLHYGFMEQPNIPEALFACHADGLDFNMMQTSFFLSKETVVPGRFSRFGALRRQIFIAMNRNAQDATEFFHIPANRAVEIGSHVEI